MFDAYVRTDPRLEHVCEHLAAARSRDDVVSALCRWTRQAVGCDGVAVALREGAFCRYVAENAIEPLWKNQRFPLADCVSGWAMLNGATAVVPDVALDPRVPAAPYRRTSIRSLVMAPVGAPEAVAALGTYWCAFVALDAETVGRVEHLARRAGEALARLRERDPADPAAVA
ncbi:GAF domain-containing protein [Methylobacterium radiodurans]|uniref:GAF domain-containing protein n=1 Tax=Methylobacterium radiodurans TaxID=2202828 RepID=A0A2U8VUC3_9HYPH|nr:GAF domain-containing protein [Methylobacterium radiodurans]AWN36842.1 GAF domain-containing protein [Methylobacterium radiodurans]